jgi:hypothetical protein
MFGHYRIGLATLFLLSLLGLWGCAGAAGSAAGTPSNMSGNTASGTSGTNVAVFPFAASTTPGGAVQFSVSVTGTPNQAVSWSVNGQAAGNATVGTVSSTGLYLAPATVPNPPTVSITATSQASPASFATAMVTVSGRNQNQEAQGFPVKLGTSGGNVQDTNSGAGQIFCCSGTLGSLVQRGGQQFILSNNHVLDRSGKGSIGDAISQPGLVDANCNSSAVETVANLSQAATLTSSNVDAALAVVVTGAVDPSGTILGLGTVSGGSIGDAPPASTTADPATVLAAGEPVAKSGRATGLTCSTLESISTSVLVDYPAACGDSTSAFSVTFNNQVIVQGGAFSGAGDSGSLIVTADTAQPVALLYAGTSQSSAGNPIGDVLAALADPKTSEQPTIVGGGQHPVACLGMSTHAVAAEQTLSEAETARATMARQVAGSQLPANGSIAAIDIGASRDAPGEAALVIQVKQGVLPSSIPAQINGVRTKLVATPNASSGGASDWSTTQLTSQELSLSAAVKNRRADSLLHEAGVIGVGVGASLDAPGESAVIVYLERGVPSAPIPATLDGRRTRVIATDRFRSFAWGYEQRPVCGASSVPGTTHSAGPLVKEKF